MAASWVFSAWYPTILTASRQADYETMTGG